MTRRAAIIVLDGLGIGSAPDSAAYGDTGSDTLGNVARAVGGLRLPNLAALGLGSCAPLAGMAPAPSPQAAFGICVPASAGKDSITGHWEICGLHPADSVPDLPVGFSRRGDRGVLASDRARCAGEPAGIRNAGARRFRRRAPADRQMDRLHVGRQCVPGRRARGDGAARRAICRLRRGAGDAPGGARGLAGDRSTVHRTAGRVGPHAATQGLQSSAAGADAARSTRRHAHSARWRGQGG